MWIYWGEKMSGRVDQVPGLLHVATRFHHINNVPLFPIASYVVLHDGTEHGVRLSSKSIWYCWLRALIGALAVAAAAAAAVYGTLGFDERMPAARAALLIPAAWCAGGALLMLVGLWMTYRLSRADYGRARHLAEKFNLPALVVDRAFGLAG